MIGDEDLNDNDDDNDVSHLLDLAVILLQVKFEVSSRLSRFNRLPLVHLHCLFDDGEDGDHDDDEHFQMMIANSRIYSIHIVEGDLIKLNPRN